MYASVSVHESLKSIVLSRIHRTRFACCASHNTLNMGGTMAGFSPVGTGKMIRMDTVFVSFASFDAANPPASGPRTSAGGSSAQPIVDIQKIVSEIVRRTLNIGIPFR